VQWSQPGTPPGGWWEILYGTSSGHYTGTAWPSSTTSTSYTVESLQSRVTYYFRVVYVDESGAFHDSNELSITTQ
jgi:hypothetical protein